MSFIFLAQEKGYKNKHHPRGMVAWKRGMLPGVRNVLIVPQSTN